MEFVMVTYPTKRSVNVDGELTGDTNEVLQMEEGTHKFDLGVPANYQPALCPAFPLIALFKFPRPLLSLKPATTTADGKYLIEGVPVGEQEISAHKTSGATKSAGAGKVTIVFDKTATCDIAVS